MQTRPFSSNLECTGRSSYSWTQFWRKDEDISRTDTDKTQQKSDLLSGDCMETRYSEACRRGCHWTHMLLGRTWYVDKPETPRNTGSERETHTRTHGVYYLFCCAASDVHATKQLVRLLEIRTQQDMSIYI